MALRVFVDSDVIISSLLSSTGAAYLLLNKTHNLNLCISDQSIRELQAVAKRLHIDQKKLTHLIEKRFTVVTLQKPLEEIQQALADYVSDTHDAHIVAGANVGKAMFLISYNVKHFHAQMLRENLKIILMTPATFLQYLRSKA